MSQQQRYRLGFSILLIAYAVVGVFGRFPWKADEPYSFGIVWEMLLNDRWVVPHIAGQPFVEKPPLVYWLGALFARLLPGPPAHESSRLGSLLLVAVSAGAVFACARLLWPETRRWRVAVDRNAESQRSCDYVLAALALCAGTLGLVEQIHKFTADVGQLCGAMVGLAGLLRIPALAFRKRRRPWDGTTAGVLVGVGAGIGFLSKGLLVPGLIGLTWLTALAIPVFRSRVAGCAAITALLSVLPWLLVWPTLLYAQSPELFREWLWTNNAGRFLGSVSLGGSGVPIGHRLGSLALAGFPSGLLAASVLIRTVQDLRQLRGSGWNAGRDAPAHLCLALYLSVGVVVLLASAAFRDNYLLPLLPAVALLGLPAMGQSTAFKESHRTIVLDTAFALMATALLCVWASLVMTANLPATVAAVVRNFLPLPFDLEVDAVSRTETLIKGKLLQAAAAPYRFDAAAGLSYFVKLATEHGERTLWGVDLERALVESITRVKVGDDVAIENQGSRPVTVKQLKRDSDGRLADTRIATHRNRWLIEKPEHFEERAERAAAFTAGVSSRDDLARQRPDLTAALVNLWLGEQFAKRFVERPEDQARVVDIVKSRLTQALERGDIIDSPRIKEEVRARFGLTDAVDDRPPPTRSRVIRSPQQDPSRTAHARVIG